MSIFFKRNRIYFYIFLILVFILLAVWIRDMNIVDICRRYLTEPDYKVWVTEEANKYGTTEVKDLWSLIYAFLTWPMFTLSSSFNNATIYISLIVPVLASICTYRFHTRLNREYQMKLYRSDRMNSFFFKEMMAEGLKMAAVLYAAVIVIMIIIYLFQGNNVVTEPFDLLLTDILPESFYMSHPFVFHLMQYLIADFIAPLVWFVAFQVIAFHEHDKKKLFAIPIGIFLGLSFLFEYLARFYLGFLYLAPTIIINSSVIEWFHSYGLLLSLLIPVASATIYYFMQRKKMEI